MILSEQVKLKATGWKQAEMALLLQQMKGGKEYV
jgi:hypothetical protein